MRGDGWIRGPQWASPSVEAEWADRLEAAALAWLELEVLSVSAGVRDSALLFLTPDELVRATAEAGQVGLLVVPLTWDGQSVRAAVCAPALAREWLRAWRSSDDESIGELLGFPPCCRAFFRRVWGELQLRDTTAAMVANGGSEWAEGPAGANILLRRLGVRLVPHLPCSFQCSSTVAMAERMIAVAREAGIEDVDEIERLLNLPMEWSARNGAATVDIGGVFRFVYETDASEASTFRRVGRPGKLWTRLLEPPAWRDNGFRSRSSMAAAHAVVAAAVGRVHSAIDLGAGDGALLELVAGGRAGEWDALEVDADRVARGRRRRPRVKFTIGRIEDLPTAWFAPKADVAILMPGRLLEMDAMTATSVRAMLPLVARRLVVYQYGDWAQRGGLMQLCAAAGITYPLGQIYSGSGVEAAEVLWQ